jgi:predicted GNAT family N-acyltransferase
MNPHIYTTTWKKDSSRLAALRREVFIVEQSVSEELEWDEHDASAVHFICEDITEETTIGCARLVIDTNTRKATIGRLCVVKNFRRQNAATYLMQKMLAYCEDQKLLTIELHAQLYLRTFYENFDFVAQGNVYMEAGIEHITMIRP